MRKPTTVKNPQANGMLECVHQVLGQMLCTAELDMANSVTPDDVDVFLDKRAWAICSSYHTVLKASPGAAIFGHGMLFNIPFVADWNKIGSSAKQSPHMAKSHGLSLQFIQMELSGFNAEPEWSDLVSGEYNHLQMIFYKLGKMYTSGP
jgi:hypothetical protein